MLHSNAPIISAIRGIIALMQYLIIKKTTKNKIIIMNPLSTHNEATLYKNGHIPKIPSPLVTGVSNSPSSCVNKNEFSKGVSTDLLKTVFSNIKRNKIQTLIIDFKKEVDEVSGGRANYNIEEITKTLQAKPDPEKVLNK